MEPGRLESSKWSDISKKRRDPTSLVTSRSCTKAELVTASKSPILEITTWGFSFFISSTIKSDWCGASITVSTSSEGLSVSVPYKKDVFVVMQHKTTTNNKDIKGGGWERSPILARTISAAITIKLPSSQHTIDWNKLFSSTSQGCENQPSQRKMKLSLLNIFLWPFSISPFNVNTKVLLPQPVIFFKYIYCNY